MKTLPFLPEYFSIFKTHLDHGHPIIFPTETCYGFSGSIFIASAAARVEQIKQRNNKPFLILVPNFIEMSKYGNTKYITTEWQEKAKTEPITFLLPKAKDYPYHFFPDFQEVGIRIPNYPPILGFLEYYQKPIFSTSANISGKPQIYDIEEIEEEFINYPNLIFASVGKLPENQPSKIVRITEKSVEQLR